MNNVNNEILNSIYYIEDKINKFSEKNTQIQTTYNELFKLSMKKEFGDDINKMIKLCEKNTNEIKNLQNSVIELTKIVNNNKKLDNSEFLDTLSLVDLNIDFTIDDIANFVFFHNEEKDDNQSENKQNYISFERPKINNLKVNLKNNKMEFSLKQVKQKKSKIDGLDKYTFKHKLVPNQPISNKTTNTN